jgi:vitamin B12 transporter
MHNKFLSLTAIALLYGLTSPCALGQATNSSEPFDEPPAELDDLVVTAALEPVSINDVASSITVITREQIEQRQVKYLADLLRDVPGFNVSQAGGIGAQTQIRVRGAEANHMLVLVDGIRANDPASVDEFQFQYATTANIERIEIIRGPQSSIWGSDAMAGVINIIRRKDTRETWVSGSAEGGSFSTFNAAVDGGLSRENFRLQGGVSYYTTDGINIAREGDEKDGSDNTTANLGLEWDINEAWSLVASGQYVDAETQFDDVDFFVTGLPVDTDRVTRADRTYLRGEVRYKPPDSRWSGNASVNYTDSDNDNLYDGIINSSTAAEVVDARARGSVLLGEERRHRLTGAFDYIDTDFSQRGEALSWGDPNQDQSYDQTSVAAEYVGKYASGFTWTASARYNDFSDLDDITTWQTAFSYQASEMIRLRGSVGTGFKAPTFTERYGFYADQFIGNPDLKPEKSRGWELGFDSRWADGSVTFGAVYFNSKLEDEIDGFVFDPETFLFTAKNRDTDSHRKGVEVIFDWKPLGDLDIAANYTYTDSTEPMGEADVRELRRPRHMGSLTLQYRFADNRAYANLNLSYTGKQYDVFFDPATFISEQVELDSYTLLDLAGGWKISQSLELIARITNLTDEEYEDVLGYSTRGRGYFGGIRGRFDF